MLGPNLPRPVIVEKVVSVLSEEPPDWRRWLARWDAQQEGYVPEREARFVAMFDVLAALLPESFVALDVGCGPGSLTSRLLGRFPSARVVAVDVDPVLLAVGRGALGTLDGRVSWVDADLDDPGWAQRLGVGQVDAVLSTTALHWLRPESLAAVYRELAGLLPKGGVVLNGDHLAFGPQHPTFDLLSRTVLDGQWSDAAFAARGIETAEQWWASLASESASGSTLGPLLAERERRFAAKVRQASPPDVDFHIAALTRAGFAEVGTVWQVCADRVVMAVR